MVKFHGTGMHPLLDVTYYAVTCLQIDFSQSLNCFLVLQVEHYNVHKCF